LDLFRKQAEKKALNEAKQKKVCASS